MPLTDGLAESREWSVPVFAVPRLTDPTREILKLMGHLPTRRCLAPSSCSLNPTSARDKIAATRSVMPSTTALQP
jgi:hypothetical protein